ELKFKLKWGRIAIIAILAIVAFYFSFNRIMDIITHNKKEVIVPDIVKKNVADALSELAEYKLAMIKTGDEFSADMPPGVISRQTPQSGMRVREGKAIRVYVSRGGETIYVPDLTNMSIRNADIALKGVSLTFGEVSNKYSVNVDKGNIMSQDPKSGSIANKWDIVNVIVSDGEPPSDIKLMPNFIKRKLSQAKEMAQRRNLTLEVKTMPSKEVVDKDTIISQNPSPDSDISAAKTVIVYTAE
ncbi:MAG: PASTA domain-containing protein, partial [Elusimicrobiota bacterium]|nr:PASTA domain-containing protein [Elusimicrobiota bacterium]